MNDCQIIKIIDNVSFEDSLVVDILITALDSSLFVEVFLKISEQLNQTSLNGHSNSFVLT